jgi:hypothetical protein
MQIQWYPEKVHVNIIHTLGPSWLCHSEFTQSVKTTKPFDTLVSKCMTDTFKSLVHHPQCQYV